MGVATAGEDCAPWAGGADAVRLVAFGVECIVGLDDSERLFSGKGSDCGEESRRGAESVEDAATWSCAAI